MSKTLCSNTFTMIVFKFKAIATFCGTTFCDWTPEKNMHLYKLYAEFKTLKDQPRFELILADIEGTLFINRSIVKEADQEPNIDLETYLQPRFVLTDLGLDFINECSPVAKQRLWKIDSPAQLEAFLRKYAWLSRVYGKLPLFDKLLDWKDNS